MRRRGVETDTDECASTGVALTATDCGTEGGSASDRVSACSDDTVADIQKNKDFIDINDTTHARCGSHHSNVGGDGTSHDPIHWPNHGLTTGPGHGGVHRSCISRDQDAQRCTRDSTEYNERTVESATQLHRQGSVSAAHSIDEQKLDWRRTANMAACLSRRHICPDVRALLRPFKLLPHIFCLIINSSLSLTVDNIAFAGTQCLWDGLSALSRRADGVVLSPKWRLLSSSGLRPASPCCESRLLMMTNIEDIP